MNIQKHTIYIVLWQITLVTNIVGCNQGKPISKQMRGSAASTLNEHTHRARSSDDGTRLVNQVADQSIVAGFVEMASREKLSRWSQLPQVEVHPFMPIPTEPPIVDNQSRGRSLGHSFGSPDFDNTQSDVPPVEPPAPNAPSPVMATNFAALGDNGTRIPPDTHGAVGPNHLMVTLNTEVRVQNRNGGVLSTVSLDSFWSSLDNPTAFDPKVLYDPYGERFMFTACADSVSASSSLLFGVSQTSDPTGDWNLFRINADEDDLLWVDYPSMGFNKDWIVVQANMYEVADDDWAGSNIYVLNKADFYAGGTGEYTLFQHSDIGGTHVPAITYDNSLSTIYLINNYNSNSDGVGYLGLFAITGEVGDEAWSVVGYPSKNSPWQLSIDGRPDFGPQLGLTEEVQTNDARIQNVIYRNGSLWTTHSVYLPSGSPNRTAVQWWQIDPSDADVIQFGRIDGSSNTPTRFYAFPSIAVNSRNDVLIGYSRFASDQYVSGNYSFRYSTDPVNTLRDDTVLKAGEATYYKIFDGDRNRWGDYSNTVVDPLNDIDMWTIQEYAATPADTWGTWWGHLNLRLETDCANDDDDDDDGHTDCADIDCLSLICRIAINDCDQDEYCGSDGGLCPVDHFRSPGTACGNSLDDDCDNPDSCNDAGICLDNYENSGYPCGSQFDDQCDNPDSCNGAGGCLENYEPDDKNCNDTDACTENDKCTDTVCMGTTVACPTGSECQEPTCDSVSGCGLDPSSDWSVCTGSGGGTHACFDGICEGTPKGDSCSSSIQLSLGAAYMGDLDSLHSQKAIPRTCAGKELIGTDAFFYITLSSGNYRFVILPRASATVDFALAIWSDCHESDACLVAIDQNGNGEGETVDYFSLTSEQTFFIQVVGTGNNTNGASNFTLRVDAINESVDSGVDGSVDGGDLDADTDTDADTDSDTNMDSNTESDTDSNRDTNSDIDTNSETDSNTEIKDGGTNGKGSSPDSCGCDLIGSRSWQPLSVRVFALLFTA
ncbi:MAG: hypothetical protein GY847_14955 [Proteobacteria bacterium]|nr:hypothetical protein [Pseudomonadota bacterium]